MIGNRNSIDIKTVESVCYEMEIKGTVRFPMFYSLIPIFFFISKDHYTEDFSPKNFIPKE